MEPERLANWRDLMENWGRWAGGGVADPALVYYYTVSPMFRDAPFIKRDRQPPTDPDLAEVIESLMLRLRREEARRFRLGYKGCYLYRTLLRYYAHGCTQAYLARDYGISQQAVSLRLIRGIEELDALHRQLVIEPF